MTNPNFPIFDPPNWLKGIAKSDADLAPRQVEIGPPKEGCQFKGGDLQPYFLPDPDGTLPKKYPAPEGHDKIPSSTCVGYRPITPGTAHFPDGSKREPK